ncbi:hypothetical protein AAKU55_002310 [Oxalobacteraceae bacterium GrIS 1.11]
MKLSANSLAIAGALALLTACGGGSGPAPAATVASAAAAPASATATPASAVPALPVSDSQTPAASKFSDCEQLTPGTKYTTSDGYSHVIGVEAFEGANVPADVEFHPNGSRDSVYYRTIDANFIHFLGNIQYTGTGVAVEHEAYSSGAQIPVDMKPGQVLKFSYTKVMTQPSAAPLTTNVTTTFTFVGFEDLTLGGHLFANTCKIMQTDEKGLTEVFWMAKGYGPIREDSFDAQGVPVPNRQVALTAITSAP